MPRRSRFFLISTTAATYQYARPDADVSDGAWLPSTGTDLYSCVDEASYDDADFIYTTSLSACTVGLSSVLDPGIHTGHTVRYRAKGDGSADIVVTLKQGTTTIATWTETNAAQTVTAYEHTLATGEAATITDYTDLRLTFEAA